MQARAGAPLGALKTKAVRNTELVLFEGKSTNHAHHDALQ
jgi:hypothetical protein